MALSTPPPRLTRNRHLDALLDEVDELAALVARAPEEQRRRWRGRRLADAAAATLHLDGADPARLPTLDRARTLVDGDVSPAPGPGSGPAPGGADRSERRRPAGWLDTLRVLDEQDDEVVRAHEVVGAVAGLTADDLAADIVGRGGLDTLRELHGRLTAGLVAPERVGAPRTFAQAVHDASTGRIVHLTAEPGTIVEELGRLGTWLAGAAADEHPVVASGVLHAELLRIQPFDAANGRLARTAARLVLRAAGADPDGLAAPEPTLAGAPMAYHQAMADTIRRRDRTRWVERWAEALSDGLRGAARVLGAVDAAVPDRAATFVAGRDAFTLADYLAVVAGDRDAAAADLRTLLDAGEVGRVLGSHGLRFVVRRPTGTGA